MMMTQKPHQQPSTSESNPTNGNDDDTAAINGNSSLTTATATIDHDNNHASKEAQQQQQQSEVLSEEEKKLEDEENKIKYANWPYRDIKEPHPNDVLYGRGGGTNHHLGNKRFRKMVEDRKIDYVNCKRLDKPLVALGIIREWRGQTPTGRFLKMDEKTGLWNDVGDRKAREKTSQALREKAPQIREELEKDRIARERRERGESTEEEEDEDDEDGDPIKSTRFANGTNMGSGKPAIVARDHSLGREYINPDDNMSVEGFSWQDPVRGNSDLQRVGSHGNGYPPPPAFAGTPGSRMGSYSSIGPPPPNSPYDHSMPPPPHDMHARYASWNRFESWGSLGQQPHQPHPPPQMGYGPYPVQSGGWTSRDHSLGAIPLQHANITQAAYPATFDHRMGSTGPYWGSPPPHGHHPSYPPPMEGGTPPYHISGGGGYPHPPPQYSGGPPPPQARVTPPSHGGHPPPAAKPRPNYYSNSSGPPPTSPTSPTYNVDPAVASQWSGRDEREIVLTMSGSSCEEQGDTFASPPIHSVARKIRTAEQVSKLKPDLIKRATSNQNETYDTKPDFDGKCVKRAALNRDSSQAANALKATYMPGYFDPKVEVELLSSNLEQSTLDPTLPPKPAQSTNQDRMMTLDMAALDLVIKPTMLRMTSRSTTIEALNIDFDDDNIDYNKTDPFSMSSPVITEFDRDLSAMEDVFNESRVISRPNALRASQRLTTSDLIDIVNEPLSDSDD